jgi:hypothetical protein
VVDRLTVPDAAGHVGFGPTMNLGCRRALLEDVPFDESFPTAAGEDRAWCSAVVGRGIPIAFEERAIVEHRPGLDLAGFVRQHVRYGRGSRRLRGRGGTPFRPQGFYADLARRSFEAGPEVAALVAIAQIATAYGVAREQLSMLRERAGGT